MDENLNRGLHLPFQVSEDSNPVWHHRENGEPTRLSTDSTYNCVGRKVTSLDVLHSDHIRDVNGRRENHISFGKAGRTRENDNNDGTERYIPSSHSKPNMGVFTKGGGYSEVHVRCLGPLRESTKKGDGTQQQISSTVESKRDEGATMGTDCPNSGTIRSFHASFGKLCRIGNVGNVTRRNELCRLVLPHPNPAQEVGTFSCDQESVSVMSNCDKNDVSLQSCGDSLMVVDTFESEQDRRRMALTFFGYDLSYDSRDPKQLFEFTSYMERVAEFGFNHIIVIGEVDYGIIFMDCYGRLFRWEDACQLLWPRESDDGLPWFVDDDGKVYKYES